MIFADRQEAGKKLAEKLEQYRNKAVIVLALPRGGVPIGYEIAKQLQAPLDVLIVRKLGAPQNKEFGIGAIAPQRIIYIDKEVVDTLQISEKQIKEIAGEEEKELERREKIYRKNKKKLILKDKIIILSDDGLATGVTAKAAILAIKKQKPLKIILAVPVCPESAVDEFSKLVDEFVFLATSSDFRSVGEFYRYFMQVTDDEVIKLLSDFST